MDLCGLIQIKNEMEMRCQHWKKKMSAGWCRYVVDVAGAF